MLYNNPWKIVLFPGVLDGKVISDASVLICIAVRRILIIDTAPGKP